MGRNLVIKTFYQEMEGFHKKALHMVAHWCKNQKLSSFCKITEDALLRINQIILWQFDMDNQFHWNIWIKIHLKRSKNAKKFVLNFGGKIQMFKDIESIKNHKMNYFGAKIQIHRFRKHFIQIEFLNKIWTFATVCSLNGTLTTVINLPLFKN